MTSPQGLAETVEELRLTIPGGRGRLRLARRWLGRNRSDRRNGWRGTARGHSGPLGPCAHHGARRAVRTPCRRLRVVWIPGCAHPMPFDVGCGEPPNESDRTSVLPRLSTALETADGGNQAIGRTGRSDRPVARLPFRRPSPFPLWMRRQEPEQVLPRQERRIGARLQEGPDVEHGRRPSNSG
jgi:hypothetical protein